MNKVKKLVSRLSCCWADCINFGFTIAVSSLIWPFLRFFPKVFSQWLMQKKHTKVINYLSAKYKNLIHDFHFEQESASDYSGAIWFCWLQGERKMPATVQTCLKALKHHANGHPIIIISLDNYFKYISLPNYIIDRYETGKIGNAHFADIIRTCLLYEHGGTWIDSTILITKDLPNEIFLSPFYSCKFENDLLFITQCKWSNFFLCSQKGSAVFAFTRMLFFEYIKNESRLIDYFLMDYIMYLGYITHSEIRNSIDQLHTNNVNIHMLSPIINNSFNPLKWQELIQDTYLFKLSWKTKYRETNNTHLSYWGYIKQQTDNL